VIEDAVETSTKRLQRIGVSFQLEPEAIVSVFENQGAARGREGEGSFVLVFCIEVPPNYLNCRTCKQN
jgi:hypothetical protein